MTFDEVNVLGNLLNTTFGRYSTTSSPTESVTGSLSGDMLIMKYVTIMMLYDRQEHRHLINNQCEIAKKTLLAKIGEVEKALNKQCGTEYKFKEIECTHMVDPASFRANGLPSETIFRMTMYCDIK